MLQLLVMILTEKIERVIPAVGFSTEENLNTQMTAEKNLARQFKINEASVENDETIDQRLLI